MSGSARTAEVQAAAEVQPRAGATEAAAAAEAGASVATTGAVAIAAAVTATAGAKVEAALPASTRRAAFRGLGAAFRGLGAVLRKCFCFLNRGPGPSNGAGNEHRPRDKKHRPYEQLANSLPVCVCLRLFTILPGRGSCGKHRVFANCLGLCLFIYGLGRPAASEL